MHSRRHFLQAAAAVTVGFTGLEKLVSAAALPAAAVPHALGYGPLRPDAGRVLDLPDGFTYRVISRRGSTMSDGFRVPGAPDGMAAFPTDSPTKTRIVRNHELDPNALGSSPFGDRNELAANLDPAKLYDTGIAGNRVPCLGGTTTIVYDTATGEVEREHLSLAGTVRNCAGGPTPWGTWVSCEESVASPQWDLTSKWHGFNFEVDPNDDGLANPRPLKAMGRFNHEAVCVDPASGCVYQTEDISDGCLYRFVPNVPGKLAEGGKLQALKARDRRRFDARNWDRIPEIKPGESVPVEWVDLEDVESPDDSLRYQAQGKGAVVFARGEGAWWGNDAAYFAMTSGGIKHKGQIWRYTPSPREATAGEAEQPGTLTLFVEPNDGEVVDNADNLTVAPWGDLIVCEDGGAEQFVRGVTPEGRVYTLARNAASTGEFAGACFSPDGSTLFVNLQKDGLTVAVTGPWSTRLG